MRTGAKLLTAFLLPWILLELALRLFGYQAPDNRNRVLLFPKFPGFYQPDRDLGWTLRPGLEWTGTELVKPFSTDASGNRKTAAKAESPVIDCLGDSSTFGYGSTDENSYPARLSRRLGVSVRNLGVPGYTSQSVKILSENNENPARVSLIMVGFNDHFPAYRSATEELWTRRLAYVCFASRVCSALFHRIAKPRSETRPSLTKFRPSISPEKYRQNLTETVRTLRAKGSEPILLIYPSILSDQETRAAVTAHWKHPRSLVDANMDAHPVYQEITRAVGRQENVRIIELPEIFDRTGNESLHLDWVHPNDRGYSLMAESVVESILPVLTGKGTTNTGADPEVPRPGPETPN